MALEVMAKQFAKQPTTVEFLLSQL
jgi:hypothetical protein